MASSSYDLLIREVGRDVVARIAPEELAIYSAATKAYFANPHRAVSKVRSKDNVLGFGLEPLSIVLTPVVLHILTETIEFLTEIAKKAVASGLEKGISDVVSSMFRGHGSAPSVLTAKQIAAARDHGLLAAKRLKLPPDKAGLLIDAITAELVATHQG